MFQRPQLVRNLVRRLVTNSALQCPASHQQVATRWSSCLTAGTQHITPAAASTNVISKRSFSAPSSGSNDHIQKLVSDGRKVVLFMKGSPDQPQCGFSKAVVQILGMHGVEYDAYNVLEDPDLRSGIKAFSDWPTIPQVYINGQFVGGCDIILQMHQNGDLVDELKSVGIRSALLEK